jgi:hypothetical protein
MVLTTLWVVSGKVSPVGSKWWSCSGNLLMLCRNFQNGNSQLGRIALLPLGTLKALSAGPWTSLYYYSRFEYAVSH